MTRLRDEDGATLIIALMFATTIAIVIAALAGLTFTSQQAQTAYATKGKLVNALDGAIQAAVENARVKQDCPDPNVPLVLADTAAVNGYGVQVTCTGQAGPPKIVTLEATALCPAPPAQQPNLGITATATLSRIGSDPDHGPPVARVDSYKTAPAACTAAPAPTP